MWWRWRLLAAALAVVALMGIAWRFGPAAGLAVSLAAPSATSWLDAFRKAPPRTDIQFAGASGTLQADLYQPSRSRGCLLLVHGLSRLGRRQPDLERLARLLAERGLTVVVPQFDGLAAFHLTGREIDDIRAAIRETAK